MGLDRVVEDVLSALIEVDRSGTAFRSFKSGVGPYGEPQLLKLVAEHLKTISGYPTGVVTRRSPDLLIPGEWAIEFKIARPFGDNGKEAEDWSVNLLHPYPGNVSSIGDCHKLLALDIPERRAVAVIGYEHSPPMIDLMPLVKSFEVIASEVAAIVLSRRIERRGSGLVHPVHQAVRVFAWEVLGYADGTDC